MKTCNNDIVNGQKLRCLAKFVLKSKYYILFKKNLSLRRWKDLLVTILTSCWTFWCFTWLETLTIVTLVIYCTILIWSTFGEANFMINMTILWWLTVLVLFTRCNTNVFVTFCASYAIIVISTAFLAFIVETNFLISTLLIIFTFFLTERSWPVY